MLVLERTYLDDRTAGVLHAYHGRRVETVELPWRDNALSISCIPEGRYTLARDRGGRHRYYRIEDAEVHPRSAIEMHQASGPDELQGCIGILLAADLEYLLGSCPAGDRLWIRSPNVGGSQVAGSGPLEPTRRRT